MYNNELKLFQRSNESIWTDEHISKSLLETQLDESTDAASRKPSNRMDIINWINSKIKPNSKIIDLGCGPGLYAYELGKLGHNVLGIDFNKESINYAQNNKSIKDIVQYKYCNYFKDIIEGKFNAAMMIYCDFGALIPDEQKLLLNKLSNLLDDDGLLFFDVFGKEEIKKQTEKRSWYISNGGDFWSKEPYFLLEETKIYENEKTIERRYYLINQTDGKIKEYIMSDQYYDENSIKTLLSDNGFETIEVNKDLLKYGEETLFIIAKKKRM
jgi:2-polyprenyl-3-methyl-5-hydroxy-6-metoxy-1,4-benzoquinol methylase